MRYFVSLVFCSGLFWIPAAVEAKPSNRVKSALAKMDRRIADNKIFMESLGPDDTFINDLKKENAILKKYRRLLMERGFRKADYTQASHFPKR